MSYTIVYIVYIFIYIHTHDHVIHTDIECNSMYIDLDVHDRIGKLQVQWGDMDQS